MGGGDGIERELCKKADISFEAISTGKWRRYWDLRNILDFFRILVGILQAFLILLKERPKKVFSKGGYVGFPVVFAAWLIGIPVFIHESDTMPGLATELCAPFAQKIFLGYAEAVEFLDRYKKKLEVVGNPVRLSLYEGQASRAKKRTHFTGDKPVLLVMGGSSGSEQLNTLVTKEKAALKEVFDVVHLTGEGKGFPKKEKHYVSLPYAEAELADLYALASLALSRAGASALAELEAMQIPALLFPLGLHASRGDQVKNAELLCRKSHLYRRYEEDKSLLSQLRLLPPRPQGVLENGSTQKLALALLDDA